MKFFIYVLTLFIENNAFAVKKDDLKLTINYFPKQMIWNINKKDLGNVITQKMIFQGSQKEDYEIKVIPLEYLYDKNGTVAIPKMLTSTERNPRTLTPFIKENSVVKIPKGKRVDYNFKVKTNKEMSGCYFFGYYPKVMDKKEDNKDSSKKIEGIKSAMNFQFKMLSGGYLHIKGTEVYQVKDELLVQKGKSSQELNYKFTLDGNCLVPRLKIKVDIYQGKRIVLTKNKIEFDQDDRSFLPGMYSSFKLNTKLKNGKYKIRVIMFSEDENFKEFFKFKEHQFKI